MRFLKPLASVLPLLVVCFALVGLPACTAPKRTETIHAALVTTDAAHAAFVVYDAAHQAQIAKSAPDEATVDKQLAEWRAKQATIEKLFTAAYDAIAVAQEVSDDHSLAGLITAAGAVTAALLSLGVVP